MLIVVLGAVAIVDLKDISSSDKLIQYLLWAVLVFGFMIWNTKRQPNKSIWIHHYVVAGVLITFIGYQSPILTIAHGFAMGVMIEGGARWGFDPIW